MKLSSQKIPPLNSSLQASRQQAATGKKRLEAVGRQKLRSAPLSAPLSGTKSTRVVPRNKPRGQSFIESPQGSFSGASSKSPLRSGTKKVRETEILFGNIDLDENDNDPFEH
jgi:hypothetical protein